jgi:hypothetical protein
MQEQEKGTLLILATWARLPSTDGRPHAIEACVPLAMAEEELGKSVMSLRYVELGKGGWM